MSFDAPACALCLLCALTSDCSSSDSLDVAHTGSCLRGASLLVMTFKSALFPLSFVTPTDGNSVVLAPKKELVVFVPILRQDIRVTRVKGSFDEHFFNRTQHFLHAVGFNPIFATPAVRAVGPTPARGHLLLDGQFLQSSVRFSPYWFTLPPEHRNKDATSGRVGRQEVLQMMCYFEAPRCCLVCRVPQTCCPLCCSRMRAGGTCSCIVALTIFLLLLVLVAVRARPPGPPGPASP